MLSKIAHECGLRVYRGMYAALTLSIHVQASIYIVKQEILLSDVTACFNTLKKAVSELHVTSAGELQMGQASVRSVLGLNLQRANTEKIRS